MIDLLSIERAHWTSSGDIGPSPTTTTTTESDRRLQAEFETLNVDALSSISAQLGQLPQEGVLDYAAW